MVKLDTRDLDRLARELAEESSDFRKEFREAMVISGFEVQENAVKAINRGIKSGYTYDWQAVSKGLEPDSFRRIGGRNIPVRIRNVPHRASKEGEAPAADTGNLANSIVVKERLGLRVDVIANAKYSGYLEDDMNRPFMLPALKESENTLEKEINEAIDRAFTSGKV